MNAAKLRRSGFESAPHCAYSDFPITHISFSTQNLSIIYSKSIADLPLSYR